MGASQGRDARPEPWLFARERRERYGRSGRSLCFREGGGGAVPGSRNSANESSEAVMGWRVGLVLSQVSPSPHASSQASTLHSAAPGLPLPLSDTGGRSLGTAASAGDRNTHLPIKHMQADRVHAGGSVPSGKLTGVGPGRSRSLQGAWVAVLWGGLGLRSGGSQRPCLPAVVARWPRPSRVLVPV